MFVSTRVGGLYEVYVMDADGSDATRLTNSEVSNYYPFFSPDGSKIVFISWGDQVAVTVMNADGTNLERLTPLDHHNADPSWSPDGERITFYSERDGNREVYVMNADGSNPVRLTDTPSPETTPVSSPDGTKLLFISDRDGDGEIYVMNSDSTFPRQLTDNDVDDRVARWSPDGSRIIFYSRPDVGSSATLEERQESWSQAEVFTIRPDGTDRRRLTENRHLDQGPIYSPDGTSILFTSCRSGNREVWIMEADGSNPKRLTFSESGE